MSVRAASVQPALDVLARAKAERRLAQDLPLAQGEVRRAIVEIPVVTRRSPRARAASLQPALDVRPKPASSTSSAAL